MDEPIPKFARAKCVMCGAQSQEVVAQHLHEALARDGWTTALGHDDVWACPKCVAELAAKALAKKTGRGVGALCVN